MEDNKKIPENNEASIEESKAGAKKPLPKSTLIVGAVAAVIIIALTVALILALGSKKSDGGSDNPQNDTAPTVTVDKDGYVVVNGTKTEYEIKKNHSFGEWTLYNEGETDCAKKIYRRTCSDCSALEWKEGKYEDHVWGTEYISNASQHWKKCKNCAVLTAKEDHTEGDEGICTLCDAPLGDTAGIVYGVSADGTYAEVLGYDGTATKVKIASEYEGLPVKNIYDDAFKENDAITSVIIPDSVTKIGWFAFSSCSSLESVVIGDSVTSIGNSAFLGCISLTNVVIGDSVESIGDEAFSHCNSLTSIVIPDSVTSIGDRAFFGCSSLESVVNGDSITSIGYNAFFNCNSALYTEYEHVKYVKIGDNPYAVLVEVTNKNLSTYTIHEDTKIITDNVFSYCSRLTNITIPDSVTSIGSGAFRGCSSLASIVIGDSVTSIGYEAFYYCSSLASVVIPDSVTSIEDYAFYNCTSLTSIVIPDSVTSIGRSAFSGCSALASVVIGDSVTSIDDYVFSDCTELESIVIPKSLTSISEDAFTSFLSGWTHVIKIDVYYTGTEEEWGQINGNDILRYCAIHYNYIPEE